MAVRDVVQAAAGVGGGDNLYVEDVFSTYLYTGNGSARSINNGIDLAGEGGLVWIKARSFTDGGYIHGLWDTERGVATLNNGSSGNGGHLNTAWVGGEAAYNNTLTSFNSDGFSLGTDSSLGIVNYPTTGVYASWTFRKSPKFFSVVTYTGDGTSSRQIAHDLGSTPGFIVIKRTDTNSDWVTSFYAGETFIGRARLNSTDAFNEAAATNNGYIAAPHNADTFGTQDYGGNVSAVNATGGTYVAYLFASNAGGFGDDSEQNVISCGSYVGTGTNGNFVSLGFEPQWVMIKNTGDTNQWRIFDNMRGVSTGGSSFPLLAENATAEFDTGNVLAFNATGFTLNGGNGNTNSSNATTYIYIAIRRPMKTPESGTEVFASATATGYPRYISNFPVDMYFQQTISGGDTNIASRLTGSQYLSTNLTNAGITSAAYIFDSMVGVGSNYTNSNLYARMFRRAPSVFDVVCYTGTSANRTVTHNLATAPELMLVKQRNDGEVWSVYYGDNTEFLVLNSSQATTDSNIYWNDTSPTSSVFTLGTGNEVNLSGSTYVAYLFATLAGVSKVGSYTGTGADLNVDCGFSAGARFILIKRTDSSGDWYVWDSARGIVAGDDPYLLLNSSAAEVTNTDYIDPLASGFTVTSNASSTVNVDTGTYIFLAIA